MSASDHQSVLLRSWSRLSSSSPFPGLYGFAGRGDKSIDIRDVLFIRDSLRDLKFEFACRS